MPPRSLCSTEAAALAIVCSLPLGVSADDPVYVTVTLLMITVLCTCRCCVLCNRPLRMICCCPLEEWCPNRPCLRWSPQGRAGVSLWNCWVITRWLTRTPKSLGCWVMSFSSCYSVGGFDPLRLSHLQLFLWTCKNWFWSLPFYPKSTNAQAAYRKQCCICI